jgi:hypothetical protein
VEQAHSEPAHCGGRGDPGEATEDGAREGREAQPVAEAYEGGH